MDPLSIAAGAIAVCGVCKETCAIFHRLRVLHKTLPGKLDALNNEVTDLQAVCQHVVSVLDDDVRLRPNSQSSVRDHTRQLLKQASAKLNEVKTVVESIVRISERSKYPLATIPAWKREKTKLFDLQEDIKTIKVSLNLMLVASNSQDMSRIRLDLESISIIASQSAQDRKDARGELLDNLDRHQIGMKDSVTQVYDRVDQRIAKVEELLLAQSELLQLDSITQLRSIYQLPPTYRRYKNSPKAISGVELPESTIHRAVDGMQVRVAQYARDCQPGCICACHTPQRLATPATIERLIGRAFVGYAGLPYFSPKCDLARCRKAQAPHVNMEYWFPLGYFWSQIVRFQVSKYQSTGPELLLSFLRRVPDTAPCVDYALSGNIEGLKDLFNRGLASPRDVSATRGYSVLRWAMYGKQWETAKFLTLAGADPDYRPLSQHDSSPRHKAWDMILRGILPKDEEDILTCLTSGNDWVEEQNFTMLHKIVTGLIAKDPKEELLIHPEDIHVRDGLGRTPLHWVACRGDAITMTLFLAKSANPNILDAQHSGPVSYAAKRGFAVCVRLLLEAGANPDPEIPGGIKVGSPLNCAARDSPDVLVLKNLLDFGADIESAGVDGKTALIHVARTDNIQFAVLLLEYGANINACAKDGRTPLTTAITYNSHRVLRLLLDRWLEYSVCPRLQGPCLVVTASLFADVETLKILAATDHFRLKYDDTYPKTDCLHHIKERFDTNKDLEEAFSQLLSVIKNAPEEWSDTLDLSEKGLIRYTDNPDAVDGASDDDGDDHFLDAVEASVEVA